MIALLLIGVVYIMIIYGEEPEMMIVIDGV
jgi:hypothetical protein